MKRLPLFLLAAVLMCSGCSSRAKYRSVKAIKKSGVLSVYVYEQGKPFAYTEDGILQGTEVDIADELAKKLGVTPAFTSADRAGVYAAIQSGEADIGIGAFIASSVAESIVSFTANTGSEGVFAVRRAGTTNVDTVDALREKNVAVVESAASEYALIDLAFSAAQIQAYPDAESAIAAVLSGKRDVFVCGEYAAEAAVASNEGVLAAEYITNADETEFSAIVARGNSELLAHANAVIMADR